MVEKGDKSLNGQDIIYYTYTSTVRSTSEEARLQKARKVD
jgi:hypothetical protein